MPFDNPTPLRGTTRYLTTAIPYVNAAPHIGFALEVVQADALARFYRQQGAELRLQAGTDENSIKNVQAAEVEGLDVAELVKRNAARFLALKASLNLSYDDFIRTSSDPRHRLGVERLWKTCFDNDDIYKRAYRGLYCTGCEQFYRPAELDGGLCPEHGTKPDLIEEENWFFRLSRYQARLQDLIASGAIEIVPDTRRNEILSCIAGGLEDFSISRTAARARGWGIPVPDDPDQVIYVWFDALGNYVTALNYGGEDDRAFSRWWTRSASREHVIGKGISRFHAIYWPALLLSCGLALPTRILVHGYVTVAGRKIGKSAGNAIDPVPLAEELGPDALRYFLLRHIRSTGDGDFSHARFRQAYESELAGQLGNLAHRVLSMVDRYCEGLVPAPAEGFVATDRLLRAAERLPATVAQHLHAFAFDRALDAVWTFIADANRYVSEEAPWNLAKSAITADGDRLRGILFSLSASLATVARSLAPLLPATSDELFRRLGGTPEPPGPPPLAGRRVETGSPLFPKPEGT